MEPFSQFMLKKSKDGYEVILYLDDHLVEFSDELGVVQAKDKKSLEEQAHNYVRKKFPHLKVKIIKVMVGAILVSSLGFTNLTAHSSAAASSNQPTVRQSHTDVTIVIDDQIQHFNDRPRIIRGVTYIPIRAVSETLGAKVTYDAPTKTVGIDKEDVRISFAVGSTTAVINGQRESVQPSLIIDGRTMVPLRFVSETLGAQVHWDGATKTVLISTIPASYTVGSGDTLWILANQFGTTVDALKQANDLTTDSLDIGQKLVIPGGGGTVPVPSTPPTETRTEMSQEDLEWLAKMIHSEARGESLEGQIAVGAVILNRVNSSEFPHTVHGVIFEKSYGHYQFSPAGNGAIDSANPTPENMEAAVRAANGEDPTNGSVYFFNPDKTASEWLRDRTVSTVIGNHVFAF